MSDEHSTAVPGGRPGFTLVEIIMAMTLLSIVLVSLAGLTYTISRRQITTGAGAYQQAILTQHMNRLIVLPFDSLTAARTGCATFTEPVPYQGCVTITNVSATEKFVKLVMTPSRTGMAKDSVMFTRTQTVTTNPFNTGP